MMMPAKPARGPGSGGRRYAPVNAIEGLDCIVEFDVTPSRLVADGGYGSAEMVGWLVERGIEPHVNLMDKSERMDGTFSREPTSPSIQRATSMSVEPQRAEEISSLVPQATRRADEGRHDDLLRVQAGPPRLRAQAPVLPERACAQNRALCS
jgi:hypothetical protein